MTAVDDRLKLGEERRLIFRNLANGVPMEDIMAAFSRSEAEVWREVEFVGKKLREYRYRRHLPPIECQGAKAIRWNRKALLETLEKLGPEYLSSELLIPRITVQSLNHPAMMREAAQRIGVRTSGAFG